MFGIFGKIFKTLDPIIDGIEVIGLVAAGLGLAKGSVRRTQDANNKTVITPSDAHGETLIANAPKLYKKQEHVTDFAMLMHLMNDPAIEKQVMEVWILRLSENQNADVIIRGALLFKAGPEGQQAALGILRNIGMMQHANPDALQRRRTEYADAYNWLRNPEDEYFIVKVENIVRARFADLQDLAQWSTDNIDQVVDRYNDHRANSAFSQLADRIFNH